MKFSLKTLAAAVVMAAAATGAQAAIDTGAQGNGELYLNVWDANGSYTLDLNMTITEFETAVSADGDVSLLWAADANLTSFLSTADSTTLKWSVVASDNAGARSLLTTYTVPEASVTVKNDIVRYATAVVTDMANKVNNANTSGADSIIVDNGSAAYAGKSSFSDTINGYLNFSNAGTLANNSYDTGLGFMSIDAAATGLAYSTYNEYVDGSSAVNLWLDSTGTLHIAAAAVPEPSGYALLLAGLGMIGFIARRNKRG